MSVISLVIIFPVQVMNKTHALVLKTIAGQREDMLHPIPLSTLSDALTLRALNTVSFHFVVANFCNMNIIIKSFSLMYFIVYCA